MRSISMSFVKIQDIPSSLDPSTTSKPPISHSYFSDLIDRQVNGKDYLKEGLLENYDYLIIPNQVWKMLTSWFGFTGPNI